MSNYNKYYKVQESYFGNPYKGFVDFFSTYKVGASVLDLGCGQGRDAIALARLGYKVMGIDSSKVGIEQMLEMAQAEKLDVSGCVGDIYNSKLIGDYDIILLDSMFHFYKKDKDKEITLLTNILNSMNEGSSVCLMILKSVVNEGIVSSIFLDNNFSKIADSYIDYPDFNAKYRMFVYEK